MMKSLKIMLWDEEIGRLAWDERRHLSYFTYNPDFIKKRLNISPFSAVFRQRGNDIRREMHEKILAEHCVVFCNIRSDYCRAFHDQSEL